MKRTLSALRGPALPALLTLALVSLAACAPAKKEVQQQAKSVVAAPAHRSTITISLEYPARIRPRQEIVISPKVAGRVATVKAEVGQAVRAGDVLFTLEAGDFEAQNRQAKAALDSAQANLTRTSDSSLSSQVLQAQAAVKQAQVQYDDAKDLSDRTEKLFNDGTASRLQRDNAKAKLDSAAIALDTAQQNLTLLQEKGGPQSTGLASTQVDQAQASAELAQSQLSNTIIRSPITGVVSTRNVDAGELVSSAVPAFVVIDVSSLTAEASVEESTIRTMHRGQHLPVKVDTDAGAVLDGVVETISPAADPRTQGYMVKVRVEAPASAVKPGMFARLSVPVDTRSNVLVVPNSAIITETGVDSVFTVVEGKLKKMTVQTGLSDDAVTEITTGIPDGALVVTEGQSFLNDGDAVTVAR
jgi:multidrug resistance efflux pump